MALKSISLAELKDLISKVDAAIAVKVGARRRELEVQLSEPARHDPRGTREMVRGCGTRASVALSTAIRKTCRRPGPVPVCSRMGA
jgi:hypothetical protein